MGQARSGAPQAAFSPRRYRAALLLGKQNVSEGNLLRPEESPRRPPEPTDSRDRHQTRVPGGLARPARVQLSLRVFERHHLEVGRRCGEVRQKMGGCLVSSLADVSAQGGRGEQ